MTRDFDIPIQAGRSFDCLEIFECRKGTPGAGWRPKVGREDEQISIQGDPVNWLEVEEPDIADP
jgi:hypothetical protein